MSDHCAPLLAKSWKFDSSPPREMTLEGHLHEVFCCADTIVRITGERQLEAFGLQADKWRERFASAVRLAAAVHDIGKANLHFQSLLSGDATFPPIRHEWLSVWFAQQSAVSRWLMSAVAEDERVWRCVLCAVAGHHPKLGRAAPQAGCLKSSSVGLMVDHPDFASCLRSIGSWLHLDPVVPFVEPELYRGTADRKGIASLQAMVGELEGFDFEPRPERSQWRRFCAATKACLIAADVAGSALWEKVDSADHRDDWIEQALGRNPKREDYVGVVSDRLAGSSPRKFQNTVAASPSVGNVTLVEAGCGTGKTLAAYLWARDQIENRRLWFCYPTTGTATEGFRDYLCERDNGTAKPGADLFHSRAALDKLESAKILLNSDEDRFDADDTGEAQVRVDSLVAWSTMIASCTVDQVLGILQNHRSGLYAWPALAQSAFVFDEIHCYDEQLFGNLLTFLEQLRGLPVLLMTASLPEGRRVAIQTACEKSERTLTVIAGPDDREMFPRYVRHEADPTVTEVEAEEAVIEALDDSGRVLWISNTVSRCRDVAIRLESCQPITYHSRFVYRDRQQRHREVVELFDSNECGFATTTQVAELSLDLKHATLLVTELAPIPALIQRLGRLNRSAGPDEVCSHRSLGRFIVIEPVDQKGINPLPYEDIELEAARVWLRKLGTGELTQRDLVRVWKEEEESPTPEPEASSWITGIGRTQVGPIRKSSFGITVLMQCHVESARKEGATAYLLPMDAPKRKGWCAPYPCRNYPVALEGSIAYDHATGGQWAAFIVI